MAFATPPTGSQDPAGGPHTHDHEGPAAQAGLLLELLQALAIEAELLSVLGRLAEQLTATRHMDQAASILAATTGLRDALTAAYDRVLADTITPPADAPAPEPEG